MTTLSEFPNYISADTHTGRHWRRGIPAGMKAETFTAAELAARADAAGMLVLWESAGHDRRGRELFFRGRFLAADCNLRGYDANGRLIIVHPADRRLRVLARATGQDR